MWGGQRRRTLHYEYNEVTGQGMNRARRMNEHPLIHPGSEYEEWGYLFHECSGVTKKGICMKRVKRRSHVLSMPWDISAENVGKEIELVQSVYCCNWTEHVNAAKKGALPNMYKSCNRGKEEEPCSKSRVPELDRGCEWEREGSFFQSSAVTGIV